MIIVEIFQLKTEWGHSSKHLVLIHYILQMKEKLRLLLQ